MITKKLYELESNAEEFFNDIFSLDEQNDISRVTNHFLSRSAGRIVAKKALLEHYGEKFPLLSNYRMIKIFNDKNGAPIYSFSGYKIKKNPSQMLSISHTGKYAVAVVSDPYECKIGVDIERIDRFTPELAKKFLSKTEIAWGHSEYNERKNSSRVAFLWSVKEAYLKALRVGLRKDPRGLIIINPAEKEGDIIIRDNERDVFCSIFWYRKYHNNIVVGLKILE